MQADANKIDLMQARTGKTLVELGLSKELIRRAKSGSNLRPTTIYKIATAFGCDPAEIIKGGDQS